MLSFKITRRQFIVQTEIVFNIFYLYLMMTMGQSQYTPMNTILISITKCFCFFVSLQKSKGNDRHKDRCWVCKGLCAACP